MTMRAYPLLLAVLLLPGLARAQSSVEDFRLGGRARVLDEECIRLTPDEPYVTGSAWFHAAFDLARPFEMHLSMMLGAKDDSGADGIVFVFHPSMGMGFNGEGMGFAGLVPSLGIEFDTYQNVHLDDPAPDHLAVMANGQSRHRAGRQGVVELGNLEDGQRHPLRITWAPTGGGLKVHLDGTLRASVPADAVRSLFGSQTTVYWGMTAATGRLSNDQDVCIEKLFRGA